MAKKKSFKLDLENQAPLRQNPFAALGETFGVKAPSAGKSQPEQGPKTAVTPENNPMLVVRLEKRGKGKVVTRIYHLETDAAALLKRLKRVLATGGALQDGALELQGDRRQVVREFLEGEGYKARLGN